MKHLILGGVSMVFATASLSAYAQTIPIQQLQTQDGVTISGVVRSVVGIEFILSDGTGEVIVDAGPRWYHTVDVVEGERVTVTGEYDDDDFDAFRISRENGDVIIVRNGSGRPPWAGGPNRRN